jgi:hypothetical protein
MYNYNKKPEFISNSLTSKKRSKDSSKEEKFFNLVINSHNRKIVLKRYFS